MATVIWDTAQSQKQLADDVRHFLYQNGKPLVKKGLPGTYNNHTEDEYREMLDRVMSSLYDNYKEISTDMGWNE